MIDLNSPKNSTYLIACIGFIFVLIVGYQFVNYQSPDDYEMKIQNLRLQKEAGFRLSDDSPIKDKAHFKGLKYFPPNKAYHLYAKLEPVAQKDTLYMMTSSNVSQKMIRYGVLKFTLFQHDYQLFAYKNPLEKEAILFVPFLDLSNGASTYKGGRYLDVKLPKNDAEMEVELDFNLAYNPYCVYNEKYICPIPPAENLVKAEIMSGERL